MNAPWSAYGSLALAIVFETVGTVFLKQSEQFSRLLPTLVTVLCYGCAFYLLSMCLKSIPVGVAYAIWSGMGIVLISLIAMFFLKQHLDTPAWIGMALIIAGVLVINLFSKAQAH